MSQPVYLYIERRGKWRVRRCRPYSEWPCVFDYLTVDLGWVSVLPKDGYGSQFANKEEAEEALALSLLKESVE